MPELFELDLLWLDGHDTATPAQSVAPYRVMEGPDMAPAARRYQWVESPHAHGASLVAEAPMSTVERTLPLLIYPRFTTAHINLLTNPRPYSVVTGWQAEAAGSTVTYTTSDSEAVIQAVTTGTANSGLEASFTATAAAHSAGAWVKVSSGTAPLTLKFDGETGTAFTATTSWQFVKTENVTLTAATRYLQVIQTDTGSYTIHVKMAGVVAGTTYPGYFDGASGDAIWNGSAHASTSTARTGQDAIDRAVGALAEKTSKAISAAGVSGIPLYWTPNGATYGRTTIDCLAADVTGVTYDHTHHAHSHAACELRLICAPIAYGPEVTVATGSKASGVPALELDVSSVPGDTPAPARLVVTATSVAQRFASFGIQGRERQSGTSLVIRAPSLGVTGWSGALTAAVNEVQTLTPSGTISGGTYTLALDGKTTSAIAYNANAATIQAALDALSNVGTADIVVTGGPISSGTVTFTFSGSGLAGCDVSQLVFASSLTGGGTASMATTTAGVPGYVSGGVYEQWTTICDTGNLQLVGTYRVIARVYDNSTTSETYQTRLRLTWGIGDLASTMSNDSVVMPGVGTYSLVDLGAVTIPEVAVGTQRFSARLEGFTTGTGGTTARVSEIMFEPAELGLGELRAVDELGGNLTASDNFSGINGAMAGDSAQKGGTWASAGGVTDADDFTGTLGTTITRTAVSDTATDIRYGRGMIVGSTTATDVSVAVNVNASAAADGRMGVIARFVDNNNFAFLVIEPDASVPSGWPRSTTVTVGTVVGGTVSTLYTVADPNINCTDDQVIVRLTITASGHWYASAFVIESARYTISGGLLGGLTRTRGGERLGSGRNGVSGFASDLATGGTLASGKSGIIDWKPTATAATRTYRDFSVTAQSSPIGPAIYAGQDLQFRADGGVLREDSAGSGIYSTPGIATVPFPPALVPAGAEGLTNRLLVLTSRSNPYVAGDPNADAFDVSVLATPAYALARWAS